MTILDAFQEFAAEWKRWADLNVVNQVSNYGASEYITNKTDRYVVKLFLKYCPAWTRPELSLPTFCKTNPVYGAARCVMSNDRNVAEIRCTNMAPRCASGVQWPKRHYTTCRRCPLLRHMTKVTELPARSWCIAICHVQWWVYDRSVNKLLWMGRRKPKSSTQWGSKGECLQTPETTLNLQCQQIKCIAHPLKGHCLGILNWTVEAFKYIEDET